MAKPRVKKEVVDRNTHLAGEIIKYVLNNSKILEVLPEKFELVLLPEDDPEVRLLNLDLLDKYESEAKVSPSCLRVSTPIRQLRNGNPISLCQLRREDATMNPLPPLGEVPENQKRTDKKLSGCLKVITET